MTPVIRHLLPLLALLLPLAFPISAVAQQDSADTPSDEDSSSRQVEESDEAFRRRMELEDARRRNSGYAVPTDTTKPKQEKIDKLPPESRENIRDQLVDIIVENGEWEPSDALKDYPYKPTAAAQEDRELLEQEQAAWEEQVQKYNEREAAAFGAYRGPVPGPGNPNGEQGSGGANGKAGAAGAGGGHSGEEATEAGAVSAAAYHSSHSRPEEETSTAGVSESALDFLKGRTGRPPAAGQQGSDAALAAQSAAAQSAAAQSAAAQSAAAQSAEQVAQTDNSQEAADEKDPGAEGRQEEGKESRKKAVEINLDTPGMLAIDDLDKLRGTGSDKDRNNDNDNGDGDGDGDP